METKINYAFVGVFTLFLITTLIISVIWLPSNLGNKENYKTYLVYMKEAVTGLNINAPVRYNGVEVGYIKNLELDPANLSQVKITLGIARNIPITKDTSATLNVQGITGVAFIGLNTSGSNHESLVALQGEKIPIIPTRPSLFKRLDAAATDLAENLDNVSRSIQLTLDKENQAALKKTLNNLSYISSELVKSGVPIAHLVKNAEKASDNLPKVMETFVNEILPNTHQILKNLAIVSQNLITLTESLKDNPAVLIRGQAAGNYGPGEN